MTRMLSKSIGFTLIELMVTVAIATILMLVAIPSLTTFRRNAELTSATNTLVASINAARGEAMKRGVSAMVVPTNNGTAWTAGWVVFADLNSDRSYNAATDPLVSTQAPLSSNLSVVASDGSVAAGPAPLPAIIFDASGYSKDRVGGFGSFTLSVSRVDAASDFSQVRRIIVASTGRLRVCTPKSDTDVACSKNATF